MTDSPVTHQLRGDLSVDQRLALKTAATRLQRNFDGTFGVETIERFLHSSYDQFAGRATIPNFLPLLAERFAPPTPHRAGPSGRQDRRRQTHRAVPLHPQRWPFADGNGILHASRR